MWKFTVLCYGIFSVLIFSLVSTVQASTLRDSVVKVFVTSNSMDYYRPWQARGSTSSTGSGCVIDSHRIITNAHVVSDNTFIQVRKEGDPKKYTARVLATGHDSDLALLTVDDPEFFEGITPLAFGGLPELQDTVTVIGFPTGGDKISVTEGVVSRVEIIPYTQSSKKLLAVQIDAAINAGNSGGPVIQDGKLVGVAMQIISSSQNIGYTIPTPIINHFLKDLEDGKYDGFPTLGIDYHNTENKSLREHYRVADYAGGVLTTRVVPYSSAYGILKDGDIIIEVDGVPIGVDGTFEFRRNERLAFSQLINEKQIGDTIEIKVVRKGKEKVINISVDSFVGLIPYPHYFEKPSYYIYGGIVFTVLSSDLLKSWGAQWWEKAPLDFLYYLIGSGRLNDDKKKEIVVLLNVLPDDINVGYHNYRNEVISRVNGKDFSSFKEFVSLVENSKKERTIFETDHKLQIIIDHTNIGPVTEGILQRNNIAAQYSEDVAGWLTE